MEPHGNEEFLEANVTVSGNQLALSLNSKVVVDALYRLPPYRQRLSTKVSCAANMRVLKMLLIRIMQSTSSDGLIVTGISALRYGAQHYKLLRYRTRSGKLYPKPKSRQEKETKEMP